MEGFLVFRWLKDAVARGSSHLWAAADTLTEVHRTVTDNYAQTYSPHVYEVIEVQPGNTFQVIATFSEGSWFASDSTMQRLTEVGELKPND